jgi:hypothetical protein
MTGLPPPRGVSMRISEHHSPMTTLGVGKLGVMADERARPRTTFSQSRLHGADVSFHL